MSYDQILNNFPSYQNLLSDVASVIPDSASTVVDLGAGTGNSTEVLLKRGFHVTSIESSAGMIDRMREKQFDQSRHRIFKASVDSLDSLKRLDAESFDGAILVNVLYSLEGPSLCLKGVYRLLKPKGVLGISTTHKEGLL